MAVITKYEVTDRKGVVRMTTTNQKEANNYDKMLDVASDLEQIMIESGQASELSEKAMEELTIFMASNKDRVGNILKGKGYQPLPEEKDNIVDMAS